MTHIFAYPTQHGTHPRIIYELVRTTNCRSYLELGIYDGTCITEIAKIVDKAVGVDIKKRHRHNNFEFIEKTTDDFFATNTSKFDIIFIDADHNFESVKKDFENALKCLNNHGIILLHDTDPMQKYLLQPTYCGDSYKMINYIKENHPELNFINLPISEAGLTIINKNNEQRHIQFIQ